MIVNPQTSPGIHGRVIFLVFGKKIGFPIGKALVFRDFLPEKNGVNSLQAVVVDAVFVNKRLQVDKVLRFLLRTFAQGGEIVAKRSS